MIELFRPGDQHRLVAHVRFGFIACYVVSCIAAGLLLPLVLRAAQTPVRAVLLAVFYVAVIVAFAAGTAALYFRRLPVSKRLLFGLIVWLAPVAVLCSRGGVPALFGAGAFAFASAKLFQSRAAESSAAPFRITGLVCVAYLGFAAAAAGNTVIATVLFALSCFFLGWIERRQGWSEERSIQFPKRALEATFLTFVLLLLQLHFTMPRRLATPAGSGNAKREDLQSGIILLAKTKTPVLLNLPRKTEFSTTKRLLVSKTTSIPFSGEYWIYLPPRMRPPLGSLVQPGDPTTLDMTLQGWGSLRMQAQQRIGNAVDAHCCRWIDIVINGKDQEPKSVFLELILVNSSVKEHNAQTLGWQPLAPSARFAIPNYSAIQSFDELDVVFHLEEPRKGRSATVSIDRFDLIP